MAFYKDSIVRAKSDCDPPRLRLRNARIQFFAGLLRCFEVGLSIAGRILQLADGILNLAFDLLNRAFDLGSGVAGQVPDMTLGASYHFVDRAFHSVLVHVSTLLRSSCSRIPGRPQYQKEHIQRRSALSPAKPAFSWSKSPGHALRSNRPGAFNARYSPRCR